MTYEFKNQDPLSLTTIERIENFITNYLQVFNYGDLYFKFERIDKNKTMLKQTFAITIKPQVLAEVLSYVAERNPTMVIYPHNEREIEIRGY